MVNISCLGMFAAFLVGDLYCVGETKYSLIVTIMTIKKASDCFSECFF